MLTTLIDYSDPYKMNVQFDGVNNGSRCRNVTECGKGHHLIEGCNMRRITCLEMRSEVWLHWEGGNVMYKAPNRSGQISDFRSDQILDQIRSY